MKTVFLIFKALLFVLPLIICVAFFTLLERKIMGGIQRRRGPDIIGNWGLLQPLADGLKLIFKESVLPSSANSHLFVIAPLLSFSLALIGWIVIPFGNDSVFADLNLGVLYIFGISSLGVYGIIVSGWSSNSKYSFLGGLRSAAQIVSYEVSIGFIIIVLIYIVGSLSITDVVEAQESGWFIVPLFPLFCLFIISGLAETNRHPFDLPEAEAELVAGYNVEYSGIGFALFFLGEYANIILMAILAVILFFGGWYPPCVCPTACLLLLDMLPHGLVLGIKAIPIFGFFVWARAAFPRYRYDQLIRLGWKVFLPVSLGWIFVALGFLSSLGELAIPM